jgi:hypothetical protein
VKNKIYNNMKAFKILLVFASVALLAACSEEFLEVAPKGSLDAAALESPAGIEASLISAYSMIDGWNGTWGNLGPWGKDAGHWIWSNVASDDAHKGSDAGDIVDITQIELYQWLPSNGLIEDLFTERYEGIARANATAALNNASETIDPARQAEITGEVAFLRAHFHFDLWKNFRNVPYYTEEDFDFRKANNEDIIPRIVADFQTAINNLPTSFSEVGRANRTAAQAYLGKVFMHNGQFAEAREQLSAVVNSGQYALNPCFYDNFNAATDNSVESIFAVQYSVNDGDPNANNGNYGTRLGFPHSGSPFGCCGFNQPSADLANAFRTDEAGLPIPVTQGEDLAVGMTVDPRLDWTVGRDDVPYYDYGLHNPTWIRDRSFAGVYSTKKAQYQAAQTEFNSANSPGAWGPQVSAINYNIIRYADVLLMLAEAEVELGNLEAARALVNQVRSRAGGCVQGASSITTSMDDPEITWATYSVGTYDDAWTNAGAAREAVRLERRLELAMEGHRMYDLRRYGTLQSTMNDYFARNNARADGDPLKRNYLSDAQNVDGRYMAYPIPSQQILLSSIEGTPMLQQNEGF